MPTYEYKCERCGHQFELFQKISDPPETKCPRCEGPVRRLIGPGAGLIFKGSGFYATDYRSPEYKERLKAEKGDSSATAPSPAKTDSSKADATGPSAPGTKAKEPKKEQGS